MVAKNIKRERKTGDWVKRGEGVMEGGREVFMEITKKKLTPHK